MTYQEYLSSPVWALLRRQRLAMDNHECVLCGDPARHVHHRRYPKQLGQETVNDLISLCGDCHAKFHGKPASMSCRPALVPPTPEMAQVRSEMVAAERCGDGEWGMYLFAKYVAMRRNQMAGM